MAGLEDLYPQFSEFARRSVRNLGPAVDAVKTGFGFDLSAMADNARANNAAIKAGGATVTKALSGQEPTAQEWDAMHASPAMGFGTDAGGGGAFAATYGGRLSKVPNKRQLSSAQYAARRGDLTADQIRDKYGWFQGPDGDWKFEIPDNNARLIPEPDPTIAAYIFDVWNPNGYKLEHPELLRAYPELKQYKFRVHSRDDHMSEAYHDAANKVISLASDLPPTEALKSLLHELQHGVQTIEGFNPGASPWHPAVKDIAHGSLMAKVNNAYSAMQRFNSTINQWVNQQPRPSSVQDAWNMRQRFRQENPELAAEYDAAQDILQNEPRHRRDEEYNTYQRALGETEARDAMERWNLTPEQRATITPYYLGRIRGVNEPFDAAQDIDLRAHLARQPAKAADVPPDTRALITRHLGLSPE